MKYLPAAFFSLFVLVLLAKPASAGLVINEVLANEPGQETTLEWVELYNDSSEAIDLLPYDLYVDGLQRRLSGVIEPYHYFIVCRKLFSDSISRGFEGVWGNNSGVWGDSPEENYAQPFQTSFSLRNFSGSLVIRDNFLTTISVFSWDQSGEDGKSWERVSPGVSTIGQSIDFSGSTPGMVNSLTLLSNDLSLDSVAVASELGGARLSFIIRNRGLNPLSGKDLTVYRYNPQDSLDDSDALDTLDIPGLLPDSVAIITTTVTLSNLYEHLGAVLSSDDRLRNNRRDFFAPGDDYPPVRLSECLPNPTDNLQSEWIELYNRHDSTIDLSGWYIGDSVGNYLVTAGSLTVDAGQYIVLVQDSVYFSFFYPDFAGQFFEPAQWPTLNNDGDVIRLIDPYGIEADRFAYEAVYDSNYTWARSGRTGQEDKWGRSVTSGGSPGEPNKIVLYTGSTKIYTEPQIFSPNNDGIEDVVTIGVEAPEADTYTLKIYDRQGRVVKTFLDGQSSLQAEFVWDGKSDDGKQQPIGIYIVYFEAVGVESTKTTVVIAR